jgi:hypothetical protein
MATILFGLCPLKPGPPHIHRQLTMEETHPREIVILAAMVRARMEQSQAGQQDIWKEPLLVRGLQCLPHVEQNSTESRKVKRNVDLCFKAQISPL